MASNSLRGPPCSPSPPGQEKRQKTEQTPLTHTSAAEQRPGQLPMACPPHPDEPRAQRLQQQRWEGRKQPQVYQVGGTSPMQSPASAAGSICELWLSLVSTGERHYSLLTATWRQWTHRHSTSQGTYCKTLTLRAHNSA